MGKVNIPHPGAMYSRLKKIIANLELDASKIVSGILKVERGGTGVSSNPSMLVNLGSTEADTVFKATPRPGVTGTLPVARGGTGAADAATARSNIGAAATSHNHAAGNITAGTFASTGVCALTGTDYGTYRVRNIAAGTGAMTAGSTALANGNIYFQYS